jgi:hypothetical protein
MERFETYELGKCGIRAFEMEALRQRVIAHAAEIQSQFPGVLDIVGGITENEEEVDLLAVMTSQSRTHVLFAGHSSFCDDYT